MYIIVILFFAMLLAVWTGYKTGYKKPGFYHILICIVIFITLDLQLYRRGLIKLDAEIAIMQKLNQQSFNIN